MKKRKTLLLIYAASKLRKGFLNNIVTRYQPLSLGIIAALTPKDWKIKLIDENFREFRYYPADLVGITAFTSTVTRAYEIAQMYREKGTPVVLGGIHASMVPDEALQYVDSVVTGEAESAWPQLIQDFENGELKRIYHGILQPMIKSPRPMRSLFHPGYIFGSIQTSRGCPMDCDFCSVTAFNGKHYRFRSIDDVMIEFEEIPQRHVFILDDNLIGHNENTYERAKNLFREMIKRKLNKVWIGQSSINFADDEELLYLAAKSGCRLIFLGIESEIPDELSQAGKRFNLMRGVDTYNNVFKKMNKYGIDVIAGFMFGWDNETPEVIKERVKYINGCKTNSIQVTIMTPLPGTRVFEQLKDQGRLLYTNFPEDWQRYDYHELLFKPNNLNADILQAHIHDAWEKIYSDGQILRRTIRTFKQTKSITASYWAYTSNHDYRRILGIRL
jgi:radical SAM superfamily enzyme YgiQ (UPF0313 family)